MVALCPAKRKWILGWMILRLLGIGLLTLSLVFSIINPILGVVLIVAVAFGSNIGLSLLVGASFRSLVFYVIYVGATLGIAGLWLLSFISTVEAVIIFAPVAVAHWIVSWFWK